MANKGINKVILIGNLGKDIELKFTASGSAIASTSLATSESWKDKQTGQQQERTEWHNLTFFGKLAEIAGQYLKKGSKIYIDGKIRTDKYQDKETGQDRYSTKIIVDNMQMLDSRGGGDFAVNSDFKRNESMDSSANQPLPANTKATDMDDFDDDIPF